MHYCWQMNVRVRHRSVYCNCLMKPYSNVMVLVIIMIALTWAATIYVVTIVIMILVLTEEGIMQSLMFVTVNELHKVLSMMRTKVYLLLIFQIHKIVHQHAHHHQQLFYMHECQYVIYSSDNRTVLSSYTYWPTYMSWVQKCY